MQLGRRTLRGSPNARQDRAVDPGHLKLRMRRFRPCFIPLFLQGLVRCRTSLPNLMRIALGQLPWLPVVAWPEVMPVAASADRRTVRAAAMLRFSLSTTSTSVPEPPTAR